MTETASGFRGGAGAPLLLLHSGFHPWVEWRAVLETLTAVREVIAPTLAGSDGGAPLELGGGSMLEALATDAERVLDEAGWTDPIPVVGSSYGGVVGLELGARGRASRVIALAPPWTAPPLGLAWYAALFPAPIAALRLTEPLHRWTAAQPMLSGFTQASLQPAAVTPDDLARIWRSVGRFPLLRVARESGLRGPGMPKLERVRCPVTLVWGTRDTLAPGWMRDRWERAIRDAVVVELPGFPHQPHLRDPDRIAQLMIELTSD